jgi:hypothetical protein
MNLGNSAFHLWILETRPGLVAFLERLDDQNPSEPIKSFGALANPADYDESMHRFHTAVVRYSTPYTKQNQNQ